MVFSRWLHHSVFLTKCPCVSVFLQHDIDTLALRDGFYVPSSWTQTDFWNSPDQQKAAEMKLHDFWDYVISSHLTHLFSPGICTLGALSQLVRSPINLKPPYCSCHMESLHRDSERCLRSPVLSYLSPPRPGTWHEWRSLRHDLSQSHHLRDPKPESPSWAAPESRTIVTIKDNKWLMFEVIMFWGDLLYSHNWGHNSSTK